MLHVVQDNTELNRDIEFVHVRSVVGGSCVNLLNVILGCLSNALVCSMSVQSHRMCGVCVMCVKYVCIHLTTDDILTLMSSIIKM